MVDRWDDAVCHKYEVSLLEVDFLEDERGT